MLLLTLEEIQRKNRTAKAKFWDCKKFLRLEIGLYQIEDTVIEMLCALSCQTQGKAYREGNEVIKVQVEDDSRAEVII